MKRFLGALMQVAAALCLLFAVGNAQPAAAQGGDPTAAPTQINIASMRGAAETRTLQLRTEGELTKLQVVIPDMEREDGGAIIPAGAVTFSVPSAPIPADTVINILFTFDLSQISSGRFSGDFQIYHNGGMLTIPVTVSVKDPPILAILALILGTVIGLWVSWYRARSKPRDDLLNRVGKLQSKLSAEKDLPASFAESIHGHLTEVDRAIQTNELDQAEQSIQAAELAWFEWRKVREQWVAQRQFGTDLRATIAKNAPSLPQNFTRTALEQIGAAMDEKSGDPNVLRARLETIKDDLARMDKLRVKRDELAVKGSQLRGEDANNMKRLMTALNAAFERIVPGDLTSFETAEKALQTVETEAAIYLEEVATPKRSATRGGEGGAAPSPALTMPVPLNLPEAAAIRAETAIEQAETSSAQTRLLVYWAISAVILVAIIVLTGYGQLYDARPTFGAGGIQDYVALFVFGFSAEATRSVVADFLRTGEIGVLR